MDDQNMPGVPMGEMSNGTVGSMIYGYKDAIETDLKEKKLMQEDHDFLWHEFWKYLENI